MDTNTVVFSGRLVRDLEQRYTPNGKAVVSGTIAVNKYFPKESTATKEEREKSTLYIDFQAWGTYTASKGDRVCVYGKFAAWIDKDGERHTRVEVVSDGLYIKPKQAKPESSTDDDWSIP